jgi:hypothetical protein
MPNICIAAERIKLENELNRGGYSQRMSKEEQDEFVDGALETLVRGIPAPQTRALIAARVRLAQDLKRPRGL